MDMASPQVQQLRRRRLIDSRYLDTWSRLQVSKMPVYSQSIRRIHVGFRTGSTSTGSVEKRLGAPGSGSVPGTVEPCPMVDPSR